MRRWLLIAGAFLGGLQCLVFAGFGEDVWKLVSDPFGATIRSQWPKALSPQAPWLWLACCHALACAMLLRLGSQFVHDFNDADYRPAPRAAWLFGFATRMQTLCIGLLLLCGVMAFALHHYPNILHFMPDRQVTTLRDFLGLVP